MISHVIVYVDFSGKVLPRHRVLVVDTDVADKLRAENIELKSAPDNRGVMVYKINGKHAKSGTKSFAKIVTGVKGTRRLKTTGVDNYTRDAFHQPKPKAPTPVRKISKKRKAKKKVTRKNQMTKITIIETSDPAIIKKYL